MPVSLAINGGTPVRETMLRYGAQSIDADDWKAVENVLRSDWLTTGPAVAEFEQALCDFTGAKYAVAVNTGTAALHASCSITQVSEGDEVIVPAISFVASANCAVYQGAKPVFADLERDTLNIDSVDVARKITNKTKAIVVVDFAGHPCDHDALNDLSKHYGIPIIHDAAHSLGAMYKGKSIGKLYNYTNLSFHPVKHITTGEGGAILTNDEELAKKLRSFRHHGIDLDLHSREIRNSWEYDVTSLGFNYRIPDINCALGTSQLKKQFGWLAARRSIAASYNAAFSELPMVEAPQEREGCQSAWHLYVVRLNLRAMSVSKEEIFSALRAENIGVNVHYIPIPWLSYYKKLGYERGQWSVAESEYERVLSLPMYPTMTAQDVSDTVEALYKVWAAYRL
ncbi:UDP-4-amino-4,6-dideoxy-N-acetyl-beta-L-altrosamine transaminase [Kiloniella majae]|uniref:UDP-4-amino-4, 6-dideoxy-N-acetyl-beta-L-altrosamine transaminase n=1 Tax=Kiloniella majae TaxID=1938558 RepID=UPI000A278BFF|nr:UDP-4-amino-4,6-dideoxy-N-acetyl-beta-L-altrosamine transaminase [Kiloniella majae]